MKLKITSFTLCVDVEFRFQQEYVKFPWDDECLILKFQRAQSLAQTSYIKRPWLASGSINFSLTYTHTNIHITQLRLVNPLLCRCYLSKPIHFFSSARVCIPACARKELLGSAWACKHQHQRSEWREGGVATICHDQRLRSICNECRQQADESILKELGKHAHDACAAGQHVLYEIAAYKFRSRSRPPSAVVTVGRQKIV